MKNEPGIDVARMLKGHKIIALTSSDSEEESLECLFLGVDFSLAKPVGIMDLALCLVKCGNISRQNSFESTE